MRSRANYRCVLNDVCGTVAPALVEINFDRHRPVNFSCLGILRLSRLALAVNQQFHIRSLLLFVMLVAPVVSAQSPRPDIAWFAGGHPQVVSVAYSPDGKILASGGHFADTIKLWRTSDGSMIRSLQTNNGNLFIFGPMLPVT